MPSTFVAQALIMKNDRKILEKTWRAMKPDIVSLAKSKNSFYCIIKILDLVELKEIQWFAQVLFKSLNISENKEGFLVFKKVLDFPIPLTILLELKMKIEEELGNGKKHSNYKKLLNLVNYKIRRDFY